MSVITEVFSGIVQVRFIALQKYQGIPTKSIYKEWFVEEVMDPLLLQINVLHLHAEEVLPVDLRLVELLLRSTDLLQNSVGQQRAARQVRPALHCFDLVGSVCIHFILVKDPHPILLFLHHISPVVDGGLEVGVWTIVDNIVYPERSGDIALVHDQASEHNSRDQLTVAELLQHRPDNDDRLWIMRDF